MSEGTTSDGEHAPRPPGGLLLKGTTVSPGLVLGRAHKKDVDLFQSVPQRIPLDRVEGELNRFHRALMRSREQLEGLKKSLAGKVPPDHARVLDTHVAYLKDSVFLSDVENLILNEHMTLEAAIAKVVADFDRIFKLVENETLRERAVDLRDVGIRVLRNLERDSQGAVPEKSPDDYVLVARELSIVDMFNLANEHVLGIVTEEGGLTSHAAILARSMSIPTLTGVQSLLGSVSEGDFLILDATEGVVRVNPDEVVREQYGPSRPELGAAAVHGSSDWAAEGARTADGIEVDVAAVCGNLPEVEQAVALSMGDVGLYRTELLYLIERRQPSVESLVAHYASVIREAPERTVTFRLLHVDSGLEVSYLHPMREQNPELGRAGVRALLSREQVLRDQLQAILRAAHGGSARILIPFVTDCGELRRVREILYEERVALKRSGVPFLDEVPLGVVIETPAAALGARELAAEADFLDVSLDSLLQHLLAADRHNHELRRYFDAVHPIALRTLAEVVRAARECDRDVSVFGVSAIAPAALPFLIGIGVRSFCLAPVDLDAFLASLRAIDSHQAEEAARAACRASCPAEMETLVDGFRHGYVRS